MNLIQNSKERKGYREKNVLPPFLPSSGESTFASSPYPGAPCLLWDAELAWAMLPGCLSYQSMSGHMSGSRLEAKDSGKERGLGLELWLV